MPVNAGLTAQYYRESIERTVQLKKLLEREHILFAVSPEDQTAYSQAIEQPHPRRAGSW